MAQTEDQRARVLIEEFLPPQFLYDLGVYVQTCAHIEEKVCVLICKLHGLPELSEEWHRRLNDLRKTPTKAVIGVLKETASKSSLPFSEDLRALAEWIGQYAFNRHVAVHGAFYDPEGTGLLKVSYSYKNKMGKIVEYIPEDSVIDRVAMRNGIQDADRILRELLGYIRAMEADDRPQAEGKQ